MILPHARALSYSHIWRASAPNDVIPKDTPDDVFFDDERLAEDWECNQVPLEIADTTVPWEATPVSEEAPSGGN